MWARAKNALSAVTGISRTKLLLYGVAAVALIAAAYFAYSHIEATYTAADKRGYDRGKAEVTAQWNAAQAEVVRLNREIETKWRGAGDRAVAEYIAGQTAREPEIRTITKERTIYVQSPDNNVPCVDPVGVGLLERNRRANGIPARAAPAAPAR